jgi:hypothetical protein
MLVMALRMLRCASPALRVRTPVWSMTFLLQVKAAYSKFLEEATTFYRCLAAKLQVDRQTDRRLQSMPGLRQACAFNGLKLLRS